MFNEKMLKVINESIQIGNEALLNYEKWKKENPKLAKKLNYS